MPIGPIIIKKVSGHGGHNGSAWKVAYADFVTAMMALFIVLWLMNSSKKVQEGVGGYFRDPSGSSKQVGSASTTPGAGENLDLRKDDMTKIKEALEKQIRALPDFEKLKKHIEMTITSEGLRIELTEDAKGTFFGLGNALPSASGKELLMPLAQEVGKLPNHISIEGHTDSRPYSGGQAGYSNWELSVDRANAARKIMQTSGIHPQQVSQVRGFADQRPRGNESPDDPSNPRISLIVEYLNKTAAEDAASPDAKAGEQGEQRKRLEDKAAAASPEKK